MSTKSYNGAYGFFIDYPNAYGLFKDKTITIASSNYWKDWTKYDDTNNAYVKVNEYYSNNILITTTTEGAAGCCFECVFSI